ncbi:hypothetical protein U1Q18_031956 [Sarracenia purpurea var. burkii]
MRQMPVFLQRLPSSPSRAYGPYCPVTTTYKELARDAPTLGLGRSGRWSIDWERGLGLHLPGVEASPSAKMIQDCSLDYRACRVLDGAPFRAFSKHVILFPPMACGGISHWPRGCVRRRFSVTTTYKELARDAPTLGLGRSGRWSIDWERGLGLHLPGVEASPSAKMIQDCSLDCRACRVTSELGLGLGSCR